MRHVLHPTSGPNFYYRITALWACSEAFLGGILHGLHIPVTGLALGSFSVVCLSALSLSSPNKNSLIKATLLVLLVKALLSPQSPPQAYLAVLLQGVFAALIFRIPVSFRVQTLLLGITVLLESAFQRLIVLLVVFGSSILEAVNGYTEAILVSFGFEKMTLAPQLVGLYIALHLAAGVAVGLVAGRLPQWLSTPIYLSEIALPIPEKTPHAGAVQKNKGWFRTVLWGLWLAVLLFGLYLAYTPNSALATHHKVVKLLVRSLLILMIWYFFLAPMLVKWIQTWAKKTQNRKAAELEAILLLIPEMKYILLISWKLSSKSPWAFRWISFVRLAFYLCFQPPTEEWKSSS